MTAVTESNRKITLDVTVMSEAEKSELKHLGLLDADLNTKSFVIPEYAEGMSPVEKNAVHAVHTLNEAYDYQKPSSFSRALCLNLGGYKVMLISGTASVDEHGKSVHIGDFRAQCWRTFRNIAELLDAESMNWHDIVRTSCYLRDMSRDYDDFNKVRTAYYSWLGLDPLPASTGIQATICREDLLVEIEAIAVQQEKK